MRSEQDRLATTGWVGGFIKRHPELMTESTVVLEASRYLACTKENLAPFYAFVSSIYKETNINPSLLFNLDESSINFTRRVHKKVVCTRAHKDGKYCIHPNRIMSSTLVLCIPAEGKALDTTIIWPQAHIPPEFHLFPLKDIHIYCQNSAYQTRKSFTSMMLDYYLPEMVRRRTVIKKDNDSIIIFLDGHSSRLSLPVIQFCAEHNIKMIILPAHSSSITQPLDRCSNGVLKKVFAALCSKLTNRAKQPSQSSAKHADHTKSDDSEYIPSDSSPASEDESDSSQKQSAESTTSSTDVSTPETQITYDASDVDESDSDDDECPKIPDEFLPQSALIFKPSASHERKLLAEILPTAIRKATDYEVMRAGWRKSGLYPFDEKSPIEWLPSGQKIPERRTNMPYISGRDLTDSDVMMNIQQWAESRKRKGEVGKQSLLSQTLAMYFLNWKHQLQMNKNFLGIRQMRNCSESK